MLIIAIVLFAIAAVFGLTILVPILKGATTPKPSVFIHGGLAAVALILVIVAVAGGPPSPVASLVLFLAAAAGGFTLFAFDMQKKAIPRVLTVVHPALAVIGLILLFVFVAGH